MRSCQHEVYLTYLCKFYSIVQEIESYTSTRISGPYGPSILALAESWLASLTSCFATLNFMRGLRPLQFPLSPTFLRCKDIHMNG